MTRIHIFSPAMVVLRVLAMSLLALGAAATQASPGAHGPNGEHLDGPVVSTGTSTSAPRIEAKSETFELVGRLSGGELSMFINRFETNEPVLQAKVEVASGALKAPAPFHADQGDYAVADEAFLKAIGQPGQHPLVITVVAGKDADLLDGTLDVSAVAEASAHDHDEHSVGAKVFRLLLILGGLFVAAGLLWLYGRRQKSRAVRLEGAP